MNVKKIFELLSITDDTKGVSLIGSSGNKKIKYKTDFDTQQIIIIKELEDYDKYVNRFQEIFRIVHNSQNIFITDFKAGRYKTMPIRWSHKDVMNGYKEIETNKVFLKDTFYYETNKVKLDVVAYIKGEYVEFSCNYYFGNPTLPDDYIETSLLIDVKKYYLENKYMKMLKRLLSYRTLVNKDVGDLIRFFNSKAGRIYTYYHKLDVVLLLIDTEQKVPLLMIKKAVDKIIAKLPDELTAKHKLKIGDVKNKNTKNIKKIIEGIKNELNSIINNYVIDFMITNLSKVGRNTL